MKRHTITLMLALGLPAMGNETIPPGVVHEPGLWAVSLAGCMSGPGHPAGETTRRRFDADADGDVDLFDVAAFQREPDKDRRIFSE